MKSQIQGERCHREHSKGTHTWSWHEISSCGALVSKCVPLVDCCWRPMMRMITANFYCLALWKAPSICYFMSSLQQPEGIVSLSLQRRKLVLSNIDKPKFYHSTAPAFGSAQPSEMEKMWIFTEDEGKREHGGEDKQKGLLALVCIKNLWAASLSIFPCGRWLSWGRV